MDFLTILKNAHHYEHLCPQLWTYMFITVDI